MARVRIEPHPTELYLVRGRKEGDYTVWERPSRQVGRMHADFNTRRWTIEGFDVAFRNAPDAMNYLKRHGDIEDRLSPGEYNCEWESFSVEKDCIIVDLKDGSQILLKVPQTEEKPRKFRRS